MIRKNINFTFILFIILSFSFFNLGCSSSNEIPKESQFTKIDLKEEEQVFRHYKNWEKTPYQYGGTTENGIDCSGLIQHYFKDYHQIQLPRMTDSLSKKGQVVTKLKPGDLIFFKTGKGNTGLHIGIYYKNGQFLHSGSSTGVTLSRLDNPYWKKNYWQTRRILK